MTATIQEQTMTSATETSTRWWLRTDAVSTVIDASPERIYDLVADLPRMGEWSPECQRVEWLEGATGPVAGARFVGHNVGGPKGLMKWSRKGRIVAAERGRRLVFATEEGGKEGTTWTYLLEPVDSGVRVTEAYTVTWIPAWARIVDVPTNRAKELTEGMTRTLAQLKVAAEA